VRIAAHSRLHSREVELAETAMRHRPGEPTAADETLDRAVFQLCDKRETPEFRQGNTFLQHKDIAVEDITRTGF
jgi:hypothetical protein